MRSLVEILTQERQYLHKRLMSGPGYRKRYIKMIELSVAGHYPSANNALTLRHGRVRGRSNRALGCRMHLIWSGGRATTPLHREQSSAMERGFEGPVQWCRECGDVSDTTRRTGRPCPNLLKSFYKVLYNCDIYLNMLNRMEG